MLSAAVVIGALRVKRARVLLYEKQSTYETVKASFNCFLRNWLQLSPPTPATQKYLSNDKIRLSPDLLTLEWLNHSYTSLLINALKNPH